MFRKLILGAFAWTALFTCGGSQVETEPVPAEPDAAAATIDRDDMLGHIGVLAHDSMMGRDTPSEGLDKAAAYLASEFRRMGLDPAGDSGSFLQHYPLPLYAAIADVVDEAHAPNVVALLPGRDPELRDTYVVLSAHMDHVGVGRPFDGDSIYNGADDDASGTSALLEVAGAFASMPERPRRSLVFLAVSGEEKGLLGSLWFTDHPTIPLDRIVANINIDMIGRNAPDSVVVIGMEYSSLGSLVQRVAAEHPEIGISVMPDPWPAERFFFRSDHFSFARKEIPALFFFAGVHDDYHRPSDEIEKIDGDKAARVARLIFHTARAIAETAEVPRWDPQGLAEVRALTR